MSVYVQLCISNSLCWYVFMFQGTLTAHRVESSSLWFHYSTLITANARHFSFTTGLIGAEPSPNSSVTVQTWNRSAYEAGRFFFFFLEILLRQSSFDREIWGLSFVDVEGWWLFWQHSQHKVCQFAPVWTQRNWGQVKLQWLGRLTFQRGVTASASAKAKHDVHCQ